MLASGIVKANLGVFLSLVMVTFDIGSGFSGVFTWDESFL